MSFKRMTAQVSKSAKGKRIAVASSLALDRDQEVLIPSGAHIENFMTNPVMVQIHGYHTNSVGKVNSVKVVGDGMDQVLEFDFEFAETPAGQELAYLYDKGFQSAFSIGAIPIAIHRVEEGFNGKFIDLTVKGKPFRLDISGYAKVPRNIVTEYELLEISPVPVPSNPEALMRMAGALACKSFGLGSMAQNFVSNKYADLVESMNKTLEAIKVSGQVPVSLGTTTAEGDFDLDEAQTLLLGHFSNDGSGDLESVDYAKYAEAFAVVVPDKAEDDLETYKHLHHVLVGEELQVSKQLVISCLKDAILSGDEASIQHLVAHLNEIIGRSLETEALTAEKLEEFLNTPPQTSGKDAETGTSESFEGPDLVKLAESVETIKDALVALKGDFDREIKTLKVKMNLVLRVAKDAAEEQETGTNSEDVPTVAVETMKSFDDLMNRLDKV